MNKPPPPVPNPVNPPAAEETATAPKVNLRALALDIVEGKVFGSWSLKNLERELSMIFMPLLFAKKGDLPEDIGAVYEYLTEAGPRSINGMPMFVSCRFLTKAEFEEVIKYTKEINTLRNAFLQNHEEPKTNTPGNSYQAGEVSKSESTEPRSDQHNQ